MHELRLREQKLLELNNQIDKQNEQLLKQLKTTSKLDNDIQQLGHIDADFNDENDDNDDNDLMFDYSNINPYNKESLKMSQRPIADSQLADSMQVDNNNVGMSLFNNNNPNRHDNNDAEKLLKHADEIRKRDAVKRVENNLDNEAKIHEMMAQLSMKNSEIETVKQHLKQALADLDARDEQLQRLEDKVLRTNEESIKLTKELKNISEKYELIKQNNMEAKRQLGGLEKQKQGAEREQSLMMKTQKKFEGELAKRDQR